MLASAIANAEHNFKLDPDTLIVSRAFVDEGPTLKRFRPRAQGRASRINKRTSHITFEVESLELTSKQKGGPASGSESKPERVPSRHHHRLEVPLVRRQAVRRLRQGRRRDPPPDVQGHGARRHRQGRDRAHPRPRPRRHPHRPAGHRHRPPRRGGRPDPRRAGEAHRQAGAAEHPRGEEPRGRRAAGRAGRRRAAVQPGQLPPRDAQDHAVGAEEPRRQGHPGAVLGPPRRRRDVAARSSTARAGCRCTRCAPTSTTACTRRAPRSAGSASRSGSTRARCPPARAPSGRGARRGSAAAAPRPAGRHPPASLRLAGHHRRQHRGRPGRRRGVSRPATGAQSRSPTELAAEADARVETRVEAEAAQRVRASTGRRRHRPTTPAVDAPAEAVPAAAVEAAPAAGQPAGATAPARPASSRRPTPAAEQPRRRRADPC